MRVFLGFLQNTSTAISSLSVLHRRAGEGERDRGESETESLSGGFTPCPRLR